MELDTLILPLKTEDNAFRAGISRAMDLVGGLVDFLGDCVKEASASEDALAQLGAVLKSTGGAAGVTAEMANDLASAFQATTKFSDEAILSGESMLLTFTSIGKDVFPLATQTMLDMSQALGQDLKGSAIQLGKALNDPIKGVSALQRVGVQFTEEQKKMIATLVESGDLMGAQTLILQELQKEFGGSAEAAGQTFSGQVEILKNRLSDLKETIGGAVLPVLSSLGGMLMDVFDTPAFQGFMDTVLGGFEDIGAWILKTGLPALMDFGKGLKKSFDKGGLVGVVDTLLDAFDNLDLTAISHSIADGISKINWQQAGMDFSALVSRVGESIGEAFGEIDLSTIGNSLASGLNNFIAGALFGTDEAGLQVIVQTKLAEIKTEFELWAEGMPSSLDGLDAAVNAPVALALNNIDLAFANWSISTMDKVTQWATDLDLAFANWSISTWGKVTQWAADVDIAFANWSTNTMSKVTTWASGTIAQITTWGGDLITNVTTALTDFATAMDNKLRDISKTFYNAAVRWAEQAKSGFIDNMGVITGAVETVVNAINDILKGIITSFSVDVQVGSVGTRDPGRPPGGGGGPPGAGGTCFVAGTLVTLADGTLAPIEKVVKGDTVRSWHNGAFISAAVVEVFHHSPADAPELVRINGSLTATPEHLIYSNGEWIAAGDLRIGDPLLIDGAPGHVTSVVRLAGDEPVYNLHTNHESHNYEANGVLVHNAKNQTNYSGGAYAIPSSVGWEGMSLGALGTVGGGETVRISPRGGDVQTVVVANWDDLDIARLASEIVKAMNN